MLPVVGRASSHIQDTSKVFDKIVGYNIRNSADINIIEMYVIGVHSPELNKDYGNSVKTTINISNLDELILKEVTYIKKDNTWKIETTED